MKGNNYMKKKQYISPMMEVCVCLQTLASTCVVSLEKPDAGDAIYAV